MQGVNKLITIFQSCCPLLLCKKSCGGEVSIDRKKYTKMWILRYSTTVMEAQEKISLIW